MAEQLVNEFTVNRPIEEAWPVICDVERIAPCMPGAQLEEIEGDIYRGVVKIKLGAVSTQFKGQAQFVERDDVNHRAKLRAEGRDTGGRGNAAADITAEATSLSPTSTKCSVTTDLHITGKVAQFGRGIMGDVSKKLMEQFAANLNTMLDETALDKSSDASSDDRRHADRPHRRRPRRPARPMPRSASVGAAAAHADQARHQRPGDGADRRGGHGRPGLAEAHRSGGARAAHRVPAAAPTPLTPMDDRARVRELLGREPRGDFEVVVRASDGDPVVLKNAPLLDDGTPMPTRYWLIGPDEVRRVSQLEAAGGVRAAEAAIDAALVEDAHRRYAAERDALVPDDHAGPRPSGGVGGTRTGVKCLHAHYAWHLAGGDDPIGRWVAEQLELPAEVRITLGDSATAIAGDVQREHRPGRAADTLWTAELPWGVVNLTAVEFEGSDPPSPAQLTNALGAVGDEFDDVVRSHPELIDIAAVTFSGPLATTLARLEAGKRRRRRAVRAPSRRGRGDLPNGRHRDRRATGRSTPGCHRNTSTPSSRPAASCSR